jgi:hypothetical protein
MRKEIDWHKQYLIPILLYFQNGGSFVGSVSNTGEKEFRYKLSPGEKETDDPKKKEKFIKGEVWYGPLCYEKGEITAQNSFAMDEDGRSAAIDWLGKQYESMIPD